VSSHDGASADFDALRALRRPQTPADRQFADLVAPKISQIIAQYHLRLTSVRQVLKTPEGRAGLLSGDGFLCFVSSTAPLLGTSSVCIPSGWAADNGGFAIEGGLTARAGTPGGVWVNGVVTDDVATVEFTSTEGAVTRVTPNADHAYSASFKSRPAKMALVHSDGQVTVP